MDKHQKVYKIPMKDYTPEELNRIIIEQWQNTPIKIQSIPDTQSYFNCPFRTDKNNNFLNCYEERCLAFRQDDSHIWCARLEPPRGDSTTLHNKKLLNRTEYK